MTSTEHFLASPLLAIRGRRARFRERITGAACRRRLVRLVAGLVLFALPAADDVPAPAAVARDQGAVVVHDSRGRQRWTADWTMQPFEVAGKPAVRFTETGSGSYSGFSQPVRWTSESLWSAQGTFHPLQFEKRITDTNGNLLSTISKTFNASTGSVVFRTAPASGKTETRTIAVPPDTLTVEGIAGILRYLPFETFRPFDTHFLTNEPRLYDVTIEMRGREKLKTTAGELECYKLEMVPHLGLLNVLKPFFPKTYFWFTVSDPHFWVRYEGFEIGQGTPAIVMELDRGSRRPLEVTFHLPAPQKLLIP